MKINKKIADLITKLVDEYDQIEKFEETIEQKKKELEQLVFEQQRDYDFDRATEHKNLDLAIRNAENSLKQKKVDFADHKKRGLNEIFNLSSADYREQVTNTQEVTDSINDIQKAIEELNKAYHSHTNLVSTRYKEYEAMYDDLGIRKLGQSIHGITASWGLSSTKHLRFPKRWLHLKDNLRALLSKQ